MMPTRHKWKTFVLISLLPFQLSAAPDPKTELIGLDFGDLSQIEVTSVSKREDKLMETAAAVFVITNEDIRRSGATTVAEALRLAPGVHVARNTSSSWAIASRGFNTTTTNKLLVLIDGRSVYTPLYSGVFWDVQDIPLQLIDRIEVIRGPGAAVWGANAVNGVINIIRKTSSETQGSRISLAAGTEERFLGYYRYGDTIGKRGTYRAHVKYADRDEMETARNAGSGDQWHMANGGARADLNPTDDDSIFISLDAYTGQEKQYSNINTLTPPFVTVQHDDTNLDGGNVMSRWTRKLSPDSSATLQIYYDRTRRHIPIVLTETRDTYDAEFQHQLPFGNRQNVIWGIGYRTSIDYVRDNVGLGFDPDHESINNSNLFFQDEIRVMKKLLVTIGSKFEYNNYTDLEVEPNLRTAWLINDKNTLWGSVSRAVRTPSRIDRDLITYSVAGSSFTSLRGTDEFESEVLVSYEAGFRSQPSSKFFFDIATYFNKYDKLLTGEAEASFTETTPSPTHVTNPVYLRNKMYGESFGGEIAPSFQVTRWFRLQGSYSYLHLRLHLNNDSNAINTPRTERNDPVHQYAIRTAFNLPHHFEVDASLRYVGKLRNLNVGSYNVVDARVGWRGIPRLNFEIIGQNLLENEHREYSPGNYVQQGVYGRVSWDF